MEVQSLKVAKNIFAQDEKGNKIPKDVVFNEGVVNMKDILEKARYHNGILFILSMAAHYVSKAQKDSGSWCSSCWKHLASVLL